MFSADASGPAARFYVEDVFNTYLYNGNGSTQTIANGLNLKDSGGLVWIKRRDSTEDHFLFDTLRGANVEINSNTTNGNSTLANSLTSFNTDGFSLSSATGVNTNNGAYVSWAFRRQVQFFDVVTYTGDGSFLRAIPHNLQTPPGCVIVKRTDTTSSWPVYHRSNGNPYSILYLNSFAPVASDSTVWRLDPDRLFFYVGSSTTTNASGGTYVAILFAHDAGGFGVNGADSIVSCGSYDASLLPNGPVVNLGWEPQWLLIKRATVFNGRWALFDNLRGVTVSENDAFLTADDSAAELYVERIKFTSTGFEVVSNDSSVNAYPGNYVYIAIRRGLMKPPTSGATVFQPTVFTGDGTDNRLINTTIAPDVVFLKQKDAYGDFYAGDRLRGQLYLSTNSTDIETSSPTAFDRQLISAVEYGNAFSAVNGFWCGSAFNASTTSNNYITYAVKRAAKFFDEVCYTGTGSVATITHSLAAVPQLMFVKNLSYAPGRAWGVYAGDPTDYLVLNGAAASVDDIDYWNDTAPTTSVFTVGISNNVNQSGQTFVAYLFATCPGVSKVGSYTGTGNTLQIDCGFTGGARFVLIKRTDSTGDWYVWDSARGIVAGNDPYLLLNAANPEDTTTDWVDAYSAGFELSSAVGNNANISTASYIFLAIA